MSQHQDNKPSAHLEDVNEELTRSLKACHSLVDDYRHKLAGAALEPAANDGAADLSDLTSAD